MTTVHRVLIVGTGSIGERHARCFAATGRATVSICEPNTERRREVVERYGIAESFDDFEAAVASRPDVAVVCTPAHLHVAMATQLARAGVDLLIEKPLSVSLDGVDALMRDIDEAGVTARVAYVLQSHPVLADMQAAVRSGRIGDPLQLVAVGGQDFPYYRPAYRETYYRSHATGGGAIQDALTHTLNAAEWLVGPIDRLAADAAHQKLPGVDVEDTVQIIARHGRCLASYALNQHQGPNENTLTIAGSLATARFEGHHSRWSLCRGPEEPWQVQCEATLERDDLFVRQAQRFLDVREKQSAEMCSVESAAQTLRVNLAALASWRSRRWIEVATGNTI
ncbi:MAG: Gfo/Idh/MocA family oxidoreductase [Pirellulales bacterium]